MDAMAMVETIKNAWTYITAAMWSFYMDEHEREIKQATTIPPLPEGRYCINDEGVIVEAL